MGITISTLDFTDDIRNRLKKKPGFNFIVDQQDGQDYTLLQINFDQAKKNNSLEYLAITIADIVIDELEKKFINRIIRHKYHNFSLIERNKIQELTMDHLDEQDKLDLVRKKEIINHILNYLNQNNDLNIEGFIRFRLKDYLDELNLAVEKAVDDFVIQKEYDEFIDLLKYFVDLQEPRISLAHVYKKHDGSFKIMDNNYKMINNEYLEGYLSEMFNEKIEYEDLLVSALINIAPDKIILHFADPEAEKTIKSIFGNRVCIQLT
jgi:putative sporulation protein YtxC